MTENNYKNNKSFSVAATFLPFQELLTLHFSFAQSRVNIVSKAANSKFFVTTIFLLDDFQNMATSTAVKRKLNGTFHASFYSFSRPV